MSDLYDRFPWGEVIADHAIGPYTIREFHPFERREKGSIGPGVDKSKAHFHGYVNGADACCTWLTLDEALAGCIAYRAEGPNHRADEYFIRMISTPA